MLISYVIHCSGLRTVHEKITFMESIIDVVKDAWLTTSTTSNMQIAALYLYYALYYKQPLLHFSKMRLTLSDMDRLLDFHRLLETRPQHFYQPRLVFYKLFQGGAFLYTVVNEEILKIIHRSVETPSHAAKKRCALSSFVPLNLKLEMEDVFDEEEGLIGRMEILEIAYNEMKEVLGNNDPNLTQSSVTQTVCAQIRKINDLLTQHTAYPSTNQEPSSTPTLTRRQVMLEKISAIQRSKNTLPEEEESQLPISKRFKAVDGQPVVIEDDQTDSYEINASFMSNPRNKKNTGSFAERIVTTTTVKKEKAEPAAGKSRKRGKRKPRKK